MSQPEKFKVVNSPCGHVDLVSNQDLLVVFKVFGVVLYRTFDTSHTHRDALDCFGKVGDFSMNCLHPVADQIDWKCFTDHDVFASGRSTGGGRDYARSPGRGLLHSIVFHICGEKRVAIMPPKAEL